MSREQAFLTALSRLYRAAAQVGSWELNQTTLTVKSPVPGAPGPLHSLGQEARCTV